MVKMKITQNKRIIILTVAAAAAVCLSSAAAYAHFAGAANGSAEARTSVTQVRLNEDFPQTDEYGAPAGTVKTFSGTNTGSNRAYVRAQIFAAPEYRHVEAGPSGNETAEWRPLAVPVLVFPLLVTATDWIDGGDGYLYYSEILLPGADTAEATVAAQAPDPSLLPAGADVRLNLRVVLESAQAANGVYKTVFGIAELPEGVEVLSDG